MASEPKTCILTGARGYVGGRLRRYLEGQGWRVIGWSRQPEPGGKDVAFRLGEQVDPTLLAGADSLVHCAFDFAPRRWDDIAAVNVGGSEKLLAAAREAQVRSVVFISSLSAFAGCRSLYGKAKLQIEAVAQSMGAYIVRPGLIYSDRPGGMFGRLVQQVRGSRLLPVLWGGNQVQYLLHDEDLGRVVHGCLTGRIPHAGAPLTVAHEQGLELKAILAQIAQALGKRVSFVPVPWQGVWLALKSLECVGFPTNFRSDSLISMVYQNPNPAFSPMKSLGFECRPFRLQPGMVE